MHSDASLREHDRSALLTHLDPLWLLHLLPALLANAAQLTEARQRLLGVLLERRQSGELVPDPRRCWKAPLSGSLALLWWPRRPVQQRGHRPAAAAAAPGSGGRGGRRRYVCCRACLRRCQLGLRMGASTRCGVFRMPQQPRRRRQERSKRPRRSLRRGSRGGKAR